MYDRKREANEFVGETMEAASAAAARFFGVELSDLKVATAEDDQIAGAVGRVVIVACPRDFTPAKNTGDGRREGGRGRERKNDRPGQDRSRTGDRPKREERSQATSDSEQPVSDSKGTVVGDSSPLADFIVGAIERMSLGSFEVKEVHEEDDELTIFEIRGAAAEAIGGGDGRAVDALQLIANQVSRKEEGGNRIVIDADSQSEGRDGSLSRLAEKAADRAQDSGRSVALDPMNSRDRRIIHVTLRDVEGIATKSIGEGRYRQVLVVPEGAPEFDDAD